MISYKILLKKTSSSFAKLRKLELVFLIVDYNFMINLLANEVTPVGVCVDK